MFTKNRVARDSSEGEIAKMATTRELQDLLDKVFSTSMDYDDNHLLTMLNALFELIVDSITVSKSATTPQMAEINSAKKKPSVFVLAKLSAMLKVNVFRIDL